MTHFIKGLLVGSTVASAALVGYAYGDQQAHHFSRSELAQDCEVDVGFGRTTFGDQCRFDEVMVGIRDDYILCADLTVTCPDK